MFTKTCGFGWTSVTARCAFTTAHAAGVNFHVFHRAMRLLICLIIVLIIGCSDESSEEKKSMSSIEVSNYKELRSFQDTISSLLSYYDQNYQEIISSLNGPATDEEISKLELVIGRDLPADVKEMYRIANGQEGSDIAIFPSGYELLDIESIISFWNSGKESIDSNPYVSEVTDSTDVILDSSWRLEWIPFAIDIAGNYLCVDLAPGDKGRIGQIVMILHDDPDHYHLGYSFKDYIGELDSGLRSGKYSFNEEYGAFESTE